MSDISVSVVGSPAISVEVNPLGATGPQGPAGEQGPQGEPGTNGTNGADGQDGAPGPTAVSADAGNAAVLGSDNLIYVPESSGAVSSVNGETGVVVLTQDDVADGSTAKQYTSAEKTKLSGIASGATANSSDATLLDRANHTGTQSADTIVDGTTNHVFTAADDTKLAGIASGATANDTDANLKARANHTGTQTASTISDFDTAADARVTAGITGKLDTSAAPELIRDTMATALTPSAGVTVTPNDGSDIITIGSDGNAAVNTVSSTGSTETLSAANELHKVTMDQNCTFTFTSPSAGAVFAVLLSGAFTPTWPASVDWPDGSAPTHSTPALYVFATFDGGTTWQGVQSGKAFA